MPNSVNILFSPTVAPSWLRKFAVKKPNFLIEVFPFRGLLMSIGLDSFKERRSLFAVREGDGACEGRPPRNYGRSLRVSRSP
jgi:hypothetical protein